MGNRGILHNQQREIVRDSQVRRWIACRLEFRGRHRALMQPGHYTELFFLDEAAALAAGHRPCAECRHADYLRFVEHWIWAMGSATRWTADDIDSQLHGDRRLGPWRKRTYSADLSDLPAGTYVAVDDHAWLVEADALLGWSPDRYVERRVRPGSLAVTVLTPRSLVETLRAGYEPTRHATSRLT